MQITWRHIVRGGVAVSLATSLGACALVGGGPRGETAASAEPAAATTNRTCSAAEAVFRVRGTTASKEHPWRLVGFSSLKGPVSCPAAASAAPLPEALPESLPVLTAEKVRDWVSREQDPDIGDDVVAATFTYRSFAIVFAEDESSDHGSPPVVEGYNEWVEQLGAARAAFDRFYIRHHLSSSDSNWPWEVKNVYSCFEDLGRGNFCGAETAGHLKPTSADQGNPLPEAQFCAAYGHLHHPLLGSCHTAGRVNSPEAKCVFACMERQQNCVERVGGSPASLMRNEVERQVACQQEATRCQAACNGGGQRVSARGKARAKGKRHL